MKLQYLVIPNLVKEGRKKFNGKGEVAAGSIHYILIRWIKR